MNSKERRYFILAKLMSYNEPQKGHNLSTEIGVTRQIIVKDIAILRAEGKNIIATPEGYLIPKNQRPKVKKILATSHDTDRIEEELQIIVKYGGVIEDVIVEHPVYGEIRGMLMIKTLNDIQNFMIRFKNEKAEPLSKLTGGIHLHTIEADSEDIINKITSELNEKKFLACD